MAKGAKAKPKAPKAKVPKGKAPKTKVLKTKATKAKLPKAKAKPKKRALPVPEALADAPVRTRVPKRVWQAESRHLEPFEATIGEATIGAAGADVLDRLWDTVEERRLAGDTQTSHSARLLARGTAKVAQKLGEEAVECIIEATMGNRDATVAESADLLYHLIVVWVDAGIRPEEVWAELGRRQGISGIAEKAARQDLSARAIVRRAGTTKLP